MLLLFFLRGPEPKCWRRSLQLQEKRSRKTGHTIFSYRLKLLRRSAGRRRKRVLVKIIGD
ncbi:MAG: hypothetical protein DMF12_12230 [Verrucomicrobia bacterium]|nr:MAG: hypothetical protein DMF12_12230 [Verrucomicrobiota bacterium]